jgi:replicative DNA helicase
MAVQYDSQLELSILSAVINSGNSFYQVQDIIEPSSFYWKPNGTIWQCFVTIADNDLYIDKVTLLNQLGKIGGLTDYITEIGGISGKEAIEYLVNMNSNPEIIESYAIQLSESKNIRDVILLSDKAKEMALAGKSSAEILAMLDFDAGKISGNSGAILSSLKGLGDAVKESLETVTEALSGDSKYIETGIEAIDMYIGGGYPGRLVIDAAMSNDGKSALLADIMYNISISDKYLLDEKGKTRNDRKRHKTAFITLEMNAMEVVHRVIQILTGIDPIRLEKGKITEAERKEYQKALEVIDNKKDFVIFEDTPEMNVSQLRQKIRKMIAEGCDFVIVDQLQQIQPMQAMANLSRHVIYDFISYRLKAFAREFNVPIFLAHQMNRSADQKDSKNTELSLANLNEGGERAADAILFIRHEKENQEIKKSWFYWVKNRQGKKGRKQVNFIGQRITFEDIKEDFPPGFEEEPEF